MFYFAYGSNLSKKQMEKRCKNSVPIKPYILENYELRFVGWSRKWQGGVATVVPAIGKRVYGYIYELHGDDEAQLDKNEGVSKEDAKKGSYRKEYKSFDGEDVLIYLSNSEKKSPPTEKYLEVIRQGYKDWSLPLVELDGIETVESAKFM